MFFIDAFPELEYKATHCVQVIGTYMGNIAMVSK